MPLQPPERVTRDKLPNSLWIGTYQRIDEYNPAELKALMAAPDKTVALPEGASNRAKTLCQYIGKSPEGKLRSLSNLPRQVPSVQSEPVVFPPGMPMPDVPAEVPMVPPEKTLKGKLTKAACSRNEWDLFCETWKEWLEGHPEYNTPEDLDDLHTVCIETVFELRLRQMAMRDSKLDVGEQLNQSSRRKQKARENLTARRVDRVGTKANGGMGGNTTFNVSVAAGTVTIEQQAERERKKLKDLNEIDAFLEGTLAEPPKLPPPPSEPTNNA